VVGIDVVLTGGEVLGEEACDRRQIIIIIIIIILEPQHNYGQNNTFQPT
jgi:hypothetical protein